MLRKQGLHAQSELSEINLTGSLSAWEFIKSRKQLVFSSWEQRTKQLEHIEVPDGCPKLGGLYGMRVQRCVLAIPALGR